MKKLIQFLYNLFTDKEEADENIHRHEKQICNWGIKKFNKRRRPIEEAPGGVKGKKPKPTPPPPTPPPDPPSGTGGTIYLDFWGMTLSNTLWNTSGTIIIGDAGFSQVEIDYVRSSVIKHFEGLNVLVTTDEGIYNATPSNRRIRVCLTESNEWYGSNAGGVAYIGSFFWTTDEPAFVFTKLLNYSTHNVAEAAAHEAGHSLGLRHQVTCSAGVITSAYNWGDGQRAPTMGASYNVLAGEWWVGPCSLGCSNIQDDLAILKSVLP